MTEVRIHVPSGCKLMVVAIIRLLSLANQVASTGKSVTMEFAEGEYGAMGYLNRMGFFDHLSEKVEVRPARPVFSGAQLHFGANTSLVEIAAISRGNIDQSLPHRLSKAVAQECSSRPDAKKLEGSAYTIFGELIGNVVDHSESHLDGFAALQSYQGGNKLHVAVSDSGLGIMETLRPALTSLYPGFAALSDVNLLVEIFRQGISRFGKDRGCGLHGCAGKAIAFHANLDVRLPRQRVRLKPGASAYEPSLALCSDQIPELWGTHIAFEFELT